MKRFAVLKYYSSTSLYLFLSYRVDDYMSFEMRIRNMKKLGVKVTEVDQESKSPIKV